MSEKLRIETAIPTICVGDVAAAIDWYVGVLGFEEGWRWGDPPAHASVQLDEVEIHLSSSEPNPGGFWLYLVVEDVDALHARLVEAGADIGHAPADQEWDMREMPVRDPAGNELTFASPRFGVGDPVEVEREEVSVRLERRMLALLRDLADHKGMQLHELFEETFLHTFERVPGGGVASPHTQGQLDRIDELKGQHGIDYDTHASYRFTEGGGGEPDSPVPDEGGSD